MDAVQLIRFLEDTGELIPYGKLRKELLQETKRLEHSLHHHQEILRKGTMDPFWPDGVNANLVRNHCIYSRNRIQEICKLLGIKEPTIMRRPLPKSVRATFMAPNSKAAKHYQPAEGEPCLSR
jgi:hypothetical protein